MHELDKTLEPCPFCGGEASLHNGGPGCFFVQCDLCNTTSDDGSQERAIVRWNSRPTLEASRVAPASQKEAVPVVIDLEDMFWQSIKQAAGQSPDMPPEYMMNDWVSDVCDFLRNPRPAPAPAGEPGIKALEAQTDRLMDLLFGQYNPNSNCHCWVPTSRKETREKLLVALASLRSQVGTLHPTPTPVSAPVGVVDDLRAEVLRLFKTNGMESDERLAILIAEHFAARSPAVVEGK